MIALATLLASAALAADVDAKVVKAPELGTGEANYIGNRAPLEPSRLIKLPIGAIEPRGWLNQMLADEANGMIGHLPEISPWCKWEGNAWADPNGAGHSGWEELPYWLKGYGDLGYVLKDETIKAHAKKWIDAVIASQEADGWLGPRGLKTALDGKADLWPNMLMLNILQSWHEATGDARVLDTMTRYFKWQAAYPTESMVAGFWPHLRAGDNIESILWLYNRTGGAWLLDLAKKIYDRSANWTAGVANWHGVNLAQGFREPTMYWPLGKTAQQRDGAEHNYDQLMDVYGQMPGGGYAADENCRKGFTDPRQGTETCSWVELTHSFEMLSRFTADPVWADRCEEVAFNSLPASSTADQKALHYLTGANMVTLNRANHAPGIQNGGMMLAYSAFGEYRCCQHNVSHGWPYYAEECWLATADRGLCANLYVASKVDAKVADGKPVTITATTDYPFEEAVTFHVATAAPVRFPLYLRIPRWCSEARVTVNGQAVPVRPEAASYVQLQRTWADGDVIRLALPMKVSVRTWAKQKKAVSVDYGPLTFSLKIGETWTKFGDSPDWPRYEAMPATAWNYGLQLDADDPAKGLSVTRKPGPLAGNPFTPDAAPLSISAQGRKIPGWDLDQHGLVAVLQASPAKSTEPLETLTLIPMGAARLRISAFPTVSADGTDWTKPPKPLVTASHCFVNDSVEAVMDQQEPKSSHDQDVPRMTWWNHLGTAEWVQRDFEKPRSVSAVALYWFDDTGAGQCRVPQSWRVVYRDGDAWKPVETADAYGTATDKYNRVTFKPVTTSALRVEVQLAPGVSGGVLEWKLEP